MPDTESTKETADRLRALLAEMDVPAARRNTHQRSNIHWLNRNLAIRNAEHPKADSARILIRRLLREGYGV